jgi:hypothetical protein
MGTENRLERQPAAMPAFAFPEAYQVSWPVEHPTIPDEPIAGRPATSGPFCLSTGKATPNYVGAQGHARLIGGPKATGNPAPTSELMAKAMASASACPGAGGPIAGRRLANVTADVELSARQSAARDAIACGRRRKF